MAGLFFVLQSRAGGEITGASFLNGSRTSNPLPHLFAGMPGAKLLAETSRRTLAVKSLAQFWYKGADGAEFC